MCFLFSGGKMLKKICYRNIWLLIVSLLLITSGIYVLFNPLSALIASVLIIGILFIILGSSYILAFKDGDSYAILALGILDVFIGLLFLTNIGVSVITLPIILAFWILFNSTVQLAMGLEIKNNPNAPWKQLVGASVFGIAFSVLIFIYPTIGNITITLLLGLYLLGYGIFELNRFITTSPCDKTKGE